MTTALITLSHGSRHQSAEPLVCQLSEAAGMALGVPTLAAHLDFTAPDLPAAASQLAAAGVTEAVVVPLLFTRAFHARLDVPAVFRQALDTSGLRLHLAAGLGTGTSVAQVLAARVRVDAPAGSHIVLYSVGSSNMAANQDVIDLAQQVGKLTGASIEVLPATGGPGRGGAGLIETALRHRAIHLLPLFVADGLLLDKVTTQLDRISFATGAQLTASAPLGVDLAGVVEKRYRQELAALARSH
ncbi:sirohydrochlorin chelatase [Corynebacterium sp. A21]|uniref:sirohydrochlorin chelatase n=1 Tax=Corynebacterium sp. A21 TaxID=3457318 RepID=UPI003FD33EA3